MILKYNTIEDEKTVDYFHWYLGMFIPYKDVYVYKNYKIGYIWNRNIKSP
jgi:hypothetical protein|tara:strand:+ start:608 stop:757 length:150 start_codon:yes stop_codon:yes gene_type:complete